MRSFDNPQVIFKTIENLPDEELDRMVGQLLDFAEDGEVDRLVDLLDEVIPGAKIRETPPPDLTSIP